MAEKSPQSPASAWSKDGPAVACISGEAMLVTMRDNGGIEALKVADSV